MSAAPTAVLLSGPQQQGSLPRAEIPRKSREGYAVAHWISTGVAKDSGDDWEHADTK